METGASSMTLPLIVIAVCAVVLAIGLLRQISTIEQLRSRNAALRAKMKQQDERIQALEQENAELKNKK